MRFLAKISLICLADVKAEALVRFAGFEPLSCCVDVKHQLSATDPVLCLFSLNKKDAPLSKQQGQVMLVI